MRISYWFAGLTLATAGLFTPLMNADTVIGNERLVSTTLVVNKKSVTASCKGSGCRAKPVHMFDPIYVTCPAAIGKTCTLNIALDAKTEISNEGQGMYQFLQDGVAPVPGPTDEQGFYVFSIFVLENNGPFPQRQSYSASVVGRVTNSKSKNHKIELNVACSDSNSTQNSCFVTAHWSTMRIDVFVP